ncbi:MAG TPA: L,D-transpeptidase family protein [Acidimicrobiales bacterium]|nr:L,D-transpeptidase family protein [Acidimicrobiales bacterium]
MAGKRFGMSPGLITGLVAALVIIGLGSVVLVAIDRNASARLPSGTIIENVPVGGLDFEAAVVRVRARVEEPLRAPIVLKTDRFEVTTSPWDLGYRVDVPDRVRVAQRHAGNILTRLGDRVMGPNEPVFVEAVPEWGDGDLDGVLARAAEAVKEAPQNADIDISTGFLRFTPEKAGRDLDLEASRRAIMQGVELGDPSVRLVTTTVKPGAREEALNKVILIRTGENKLYLYDKGVIVKSWPVATGTASYPTPTGIYKIVSKIENPSWYNPGSDWARSLPAVIGPGPFNPLGTKALELDAPGILIHATSDRGSIGYNASHGCIRMHEESEAELFAMVSEGTRVAIVSAGAARDRGAGTPAPPTPEAAAAVVF